MIGESILELRETNATDESIKSYEYNGYQPITGTQRNIADYNNYRESRSIPTSTCGLKVKC